MVRGIIEWIPWTLVVERCNGNTQKALRMAKSMPKRTDALTGEQLYGWHAGFDDTIHG